MISASRGHAQNSADPVRVEDAEKSITLSNGLVTAVIDKGKAEVTSIRLSAGPNLVSRGGITFDAEAFGAGKTEAGLRPQACEIVSRGPEQAEVKFTDPNFVFLRAEMHMVVRRGVPGIYHYLVLRHGEGQPGGSVGQLRWVFRGDGKLLRHAYASADKQGQMIIDPDLAGSKVIADATFRLAPGTSYHEPTGHTHDGLPVYSKYDWTDLVENHCAHGFSTETQGIWMVQPSLEYYNGGPSKGILTVHNGPVCILEFLGGHFLIRDDISVHLEPGQPWQQTIGPWLTYLNQAADPAALWKDAATRGQQEKTAWPYVWVKEDETIYPQRRGVVTGTLAVPGQAAANALLVLGAPGKDWQTQTMGYLFWTRADAAGRFVIPKVRPGRYTLFASVPGVVGEAQVDDVNVAPDGTTNLGAVRWSPPRRATLLWRVGTPDRTTHGFRFGQEPRQFGLWWQYLKEMGTRELTYTVGQSDPAKDWYYALSVVPMPDGSYFGPTWNVRFNLPQVPVGPLALTVDLAGAVGGNTHLRVSVNGRQVDDLHTPNDSGIYRSAVGSADFRHHVVEFAASLLHPGANTVSFTIPARGNWKTGKADSVIDTAADALPEVPSAGVMFDCLQLEAGPVTGDGSVQLPDRR